MHAERHAVTVTTNEEGVGDGFTPAVTGRVIEVQYIKPAAGGYDDGMNLDVETEITGRKIWDEDAVNASDIIRPRVQVQNTSNADLTLDGTRIMVEPLVVANERIKISVAAGGNAKTGTFYVTVG